MSNYPSKEQEQWVWEQYGLTYFDGWLYSPEGERLFEYGMRIDIWALPYLFKYAVPTGSYVAFYPLPTVKQTECFLLLPNGKSAKGQADKDEYALALFLAIYKALKKYRISPTTKPYEPTVE